MRKSCLLAPSGRGGASSRNLGTTLKPSPVCNPILPHLLSSRRLNYHVEIGNPEEIQKYEETFAEEVKTRGADFKYFQDQGRNLNALISQGS